MIRGELVTVDMVAIAWALSWSERAALVGIDGAEDPDRVRLISVIAECGAMLFDFDSFAAWLRCSASNERAPMEIMCEPGGLEVVARALVVHLREVTSAAARCRSSCRPRSTRSRRI